MEGRGEERRREESDRQLEKCMLIGEGMYPRIASHLTRQTYQYTRGRIQSHSVQRAQVASVSHLVLIYVPAFVHISLNGSGK